MPHIVDYHREKVVLINAINNDYMNSFNRKAYDEMLENCFFEVPDEEVIFDEDVLLSCLKQDEQESGIEGYVYCDAKGFMFKSKTQWFKRWKEMRSKLAFYSKNPSLFNPNHIMNELKTYDDAVKPKLIYLFNNPDFKIEDISNKEVDLNIKKIRKICFDY